MSYDLPSALLSALTDEGIQALLQDLLYAFPMQQLRIHMPRWLDALEPEHPIKKALYTNLLQAAQQIQTLGQADSVLSSLSQLPPIQSLQVQGADLHCCTLRNCCIHLNLQRSYPDHSECVCVASVMSNSV